MKWEGVDVGLSWIGCVKWMEMSFLVSLNNTPLIEERDLLVNTTLLLYNSGTSTLVLSTLPFLSTNCSTCSARCKPSNPGTSGTPLSDGLVWDSSDTSESDGMGEVAPGIGGRLCGCPMEAEVGV